MGTRYFTSGGEYASVGTTRYLTVNSSLVSRVLLTSGFTAIRIYNQGSTALVWGDTNVTINSGNYIYPSGSIEFDNIQDAFNFYILSDSISGVALGIAAITEYRR